MRKGFDGWRLVFAGLFLVGLAVFFVSSFASLGREDRSEAVPVWMSIQDVEKQMATEKRKIFISVYTDWCGFCKKMDATTFRDDGVVKRLREDYYAVKFDAETKQTINFAGKQFKYVATSARGGYNQLAAALTRGRLAYPTCVILDEELKVFKIIPGYQSARALSEILVENR